MKSVKSLLIISIAIFYSCTADYTEEKDIIKDVKNNSGTGKITLITRETPLAKFEGEEMPLLMDIKVSPDNRRIVYWGDREKQLIKPDGSSYRLVYRRAVVNGIPGKQYDSVTLGRSCEFSPNGERLAYVAETKDKKNFAVLDGVEGPGGFSAGFRLVFSPDSKQLAYAAWNNDAKKEVVFLNGEKIGEYRGVGSLVFSPDGKRLAFMASNEGEDFVVLDGKEGKHYDPRIDGRYYGPKIKSPGIVFSQDSQHIVYTVKQGRTGIVVRDEAEIFKSDNLEAVVYSPDCNRIAYITKENDKKRVTVDGNEGKLYADITKLKLSPDGKRYAYSAWYGNYKSDMCAVIDGVEQKRYKWVSGAVFSPDSRRVAYTAGSQEEIFTGYVVVDGVEVKRFSNMPDGMFPEGISPLVFSPDSKSIGYVTYAGNKCRMVVNGVEGKFYDEIRREPYAGGRNFKWDKSFVFSSDGKIAYLAKYGFNISGGFKLGGSDLLRDKWMAVVNGVESESYWDYLPNSKIVFESPNLLSFVAFRDNTIYRVELEIK